MSAEYVIRGNSGLLKCAFPSFLADYLLVDSWLVDDDAVITRTDHHESLGTSPSRVRS